VEDEFSLVNKDLALLLQEFLAVFLHFLRHSGTEHHHLLVVRGLHEDVLDVCSHLSVAQHLVTFVNHEEFTLNNHWSTLSNWINLCLARSYRRPGVEIMM